VRTLQTAGAEAKVPHNDPAVASFCTPLSPLHAPSFPASTLRFPMNDVCSHIRKSA